MDKFEELIKALAELEKAQIIDMKSKKTLAGKVASHASDPAGFDHKNVSHIAHHNEGGINSNWHVHMKDGTSHKLHSVDGETPRWSHNDTKLHPSHPLHAALTHTWKTTSELPENEESHTTHGPTGNLIKAKLVKSLSNGQWTMDETLTKGDLVNASPKLPSADPQKGFHFEDKKTPRKHVPGNSGLQVEDHNTYHVHHDGKPIGQITIGHEGPHTVALHPKHAHLSDAAHLAAQNHHARLGRRNDYRT